MSVQNVIRYLEENKAKYPQEALLKSLRDAGYTESDIQRGMKAVYEGVPIPLGIKPSFWDFRSVRVYASGGEKFLDFITGFFALWVLSFVFSFVFGGVFSVMFRMVGIGGSGYYGYGVSPFSFAFLLILIFIYIFFLVYTWKRRRFFAYGLLANIFISFIFFGLMLMAFVLIFGGGRGW